MFYSHLWVQDDAQIHTYDIYFTYVLINVVDKELAESLS